MKKVINNIEASPTLKFPSVLIKPFMKFGINLNDVKVDNLLLANICFELIL
jgi:hypothetical protein